MIDLSACPISLDPSERQKLEELARQLPLIAELSACELFIDCVGDDGGVVVAHYVTRRIRRRRIAIASYFA